MNRPQFLYDELEGYMPGTYPTLDDYGRVLDEIRRAERLAVMVQEHKRKNQWSSSPNPLGSAGSGQTGIIPHSRRG